ncbi:archaellin/type IV pilin N-terminal domain-containing protein [Halorientalis salina]|uniref:archaellin/type IV pilin N-terminal domain-containing protein n=1 Tax=Halorientalis salina TaxID=2932266 RepID=UPI0010AD54A7|nr:archaellin/type IV pilin N-terminal domain-containing protein [Halorientalis salina]
MFDIDSELTERLRAQVGIGTLIVFIAMVLVAAIAAGVLINTAGFLQSKSEATGQQSGDQVTNRIQVLDTTGLKTDMDGDTLGGVQLLVAKAPGAGDIDLTGVTIQWIDSTGSYGAVHEKVFVQNVEGEFAHIPIKDDDGSLETDSDNTPVINSPDDRALLVIDLGGNDAGGDDLIGEAYNATDPNSDDDDFRSDSGSDGTIRNTGLAEGETATLRITTRSGTATTVQLVVPESLSGKTAVRL